MLLQKNKKSFKLFNKEFKPGVITDGKYCIAAKCKFFSINQNYIDGDVIHIVEKNSNTKTCFLQNLKDKYPVRICIYTDEGYKDIGWGSPLKIDTENRLVLDFSEEFQQKFSSVPFPDYPGVLNLKSNWTMFDNWIYDSTLEAKYAKFFKILNIEYRPQPVSLPSCSGNWWRIDFMLWENSSQKCLVEIKPGRPFEEEEQKCEIAAMYAHPTPVILFYGDVAPPFVFNETKDRPSGAMGIRWKKNKHGRIVRDNVTFKIENGSICIGPRRSSFDMLWCNQTLIKAYFSANNHNDFDVFETCSSK